MDNGISRQLSIDHTVEDIEERKRIIQCGGKIKGNKIVLGDHEFGVTRSLGH